MIRLTALALGCLVIAVPATVGPEVRPVSYTLVVDIDPGTGTVDVSGEVVLRRAAVDEGPVRLLLHDTFAVHTLRLDGRDVEHTMEPGGASRLQPAARSLVVELPEEAGRDLRLELEYSGALRRLPQFGTAAAEQAGVALDDSVSPQRVELASYSTWYPVAGGFGPRFDADLAISLPAGWTVVSVGEEMERAEEEDRFRSRWTARSVQDLVILASPAFRVGRILRGAVAVETYATDLPAEFLRREADEVGALLDLFTELLGPAGPGGSTVRHVYAPREAGQGGYSRAPLVVTSEGRVREALIDNPGLSLLGGTAHEAAHFWWSFGVGQGDWINEAFAEYFALVAIQRVQGPQAFEKAIEKAGRAVSELPDDAPPLAAVPPSNEGHGYTIRYFKGALLVHALREELGDAAFFSACRESHDTFRQRGAATDDVRRFWSERLGSRAALLDLWLDSPGGLPSSSLALQLDVSGMDAFWDIAKILQGGEQPTAEQWQRLLGSPGYEALTRSEFPPGFFREAFTLALAPSRAPEREALEEGRLARVVSHVGRVCEREQELRAWAEELGSRGLVPIASAAFDLLPERWRGERPAVAFVVFDNDARGYDPIVVDLLASRQLDLGPFLAHESHHWIRNRHLAFDPELAGPEDATLLGVLDQLQAEGIADRIDKARWLSREVEPPASMAGYMTRYRENLEAALADPGVAPPFSDQALALIRRLGERVVVS